MTATEQLQLANIAKKLQEPFAVATINKMWHERQTHAGELAYLINKNKQESNKQ